jgi:hypothetical protein
MSPPGDFADPPGDGGAGDAPGRVVAGGAHGNLRCGPRADVARLAAESEPRQARDRTIPRLSQPVLPISTPIPSAESTRSMPSTAAPATPANSPSTLFASTRFRVASGSARW